MPTFPVPIFGAALLTLLVVRTLLRREAPLPTVVVLAVCAVQSLTIALVQHYGFESLRNLQVIGATLIPALVWLAFTNGAHRKIGFRDAVLHAVVPVSVLIALVLMPALVDAAVPLLYATYGLFLLRATAAHLIDLPRARLESADLPRRLWQLVAISLLLSAASDVLIVIDQIAADGFWRGWIITVASSINLTLLGLLVVSRDLGEPPASESAADTAAEMAQQDPDVDHESDSEQRRAIVSHLGSLMQSQRLWEDPDLTLTRLSRRLGVPAKQLSSAINTECGENVSRYINRHRIEHACDVLRDRASVTHAMLESGFATKSNFNREFRRLMGTSPGAWRQQADDRDT